MAHQIQEALHPDPETRASVWLQDLLTQSVQEQVSDLHFEPQAGVLRVRKRLDGMLHDVPVPPSMNPERMLSRLKIMARMDIGERRRPQDGRWGLDWQGERVNIRASAMPSVRGEKIVLRLLRWQSRLGTLERLGYGQAQLQHLRLALHAPDGLILFTGPTGAGKTLSLYHALQEINTSAINIATVEDPVEMLLPGIHQVAVHESIGLDFAACLRALLRQDPDVMMVGEIRDLATAKVAVQAAQTGHLVLSTLHCNDAAHALVRLQELGLPSFHVATCLRLVTAQRLVRRLCAHCRCQAKHAGWQAQGCPQCRSGYSGRLGLFEVMPVNERMQQEVLAGADALRLRQLARSQGVSGLREDGLLKASQGLTSRTEVETVTHET